MKKVFNILSVMALGSALVGCNLNTEPIFDDKDAFVAFDKSSASISETGATISIPVTLASVSGIATTISYEAVDGTAKLGTDYELADGSATLKFGPDARTQNIVINILPHLGTYTGDLKFTLQFKSTGDVNAGYENSCVITITDTDHPLNFILNTYSGSADSYFASRGHFDWDIKIDKDPEDVSKVWISNLDPYFLVNGFGAPNYNYFYGIVNEEKTEITIPMGQKLGYQNTELVGWDNANVDEAAGNDDVHVTISEDGSTITIENGWGIYDEGWWNLFNGPIVFTKK